ncbi:MAG: hypothetical protein ACKVIY_13400 [Acidimicrobiales bacterium]|jgi:hypothetical protein
MSSSETQYRWVIDDERTIVDVADSLGMGDRTLGNFVRQAKVDVGGKAGATRE